MWTTSYKKLKIVHLLLSSDIITILCISQYEFRKKNSTIDKQFYIVYLFIDRGIDAHDESFWDNEKNH